jgi:CheY-like chemotaxis protein
MDPRLVYDLLFVEDKHYDFEVVRAVLTDQNRRLRLNSVSTAGDAIAYLKQQNCYSEAPTPDLVMIDLDGHDKEGLSLLRSIKSDPELRRLPVICLLSEHEAMSDCYVSGANCCLKKPSSLDHLANLIMQVDKFWFRIARTPFTLAG